jgi:hypothetical protein
MHNSIIYKISDIKVLLVFICKPNSMLSDLPGVASGYAADEGVA